MPLRLRTLDTFDDPEAALEAYFTADGAAFGWPREPAQLRTKRPIVDLARYLVAEWAGEPVGGTGSYAFELTLPGGVQVDAAGTSDVGVVPTHRRRGVASELMRTQLRSFADAGTPVAVLHASEAGIYQRFGYGPCTRWRQVRIDARRTRFRGDCPDPGGSLHVVQRADAHELCASVHDRVRRCGARRDLPLRTRGGRWCSVTPTSTWAARRTTW